MDSGVGFVIRLNMIADPPCFYYDEEQKQRLRLAIAPINKVKIYRKVYHMGEVCLNVVDVWRYGFKAHMWIMTNMRPEQGFALYEKRMKIEICFRDLKSLLQIDKVMSKSQVYLNKILAMVMLTCAVCVLIGESIRETLQDGRGVEDTGGGVER